MRISPEITIGHILQAGVVAGSVLIGGFSFLAAMREELHQTRIVIAADVAGIEARVRVLESRRSEDDVFRAETRRVLAEISATLQKIQIDMARRAQTDQTLLLPTDPG